jgi:hypothetical protein
MVLLHEIALAVFLHPSRTQMLLADHIWIFGNREWNLTRFERIVVFFVIATDGDIHQGGVHDGSFPGFQPITLDESFKLGEQGFFKACLGELFTNTSSLNIKTASKGLAFAALFVQLRQNGIEPRTGLRLFHRRTTQVAARLRLSAPPKQQKHHFTFSGFLSCEE